MVTLTLNFYRVFFSIFDNIHRITFLSNFVLRCAQTDVATLKRFCSDVQTNATTPYNVGFWSASWEGYNP